MIYALIAVAYVGISVTNTRRQVLGWSVIFQILRTNPPRATEQPRVLKSGGMIVMIKKKQINLSDTKQSR